MRPIHLSILLFCCFLGMAQHQDKVDFYRASPSIEINPETKRIKGNVTYFFEVVAPVDSIYLDAKNMDFSSVLIDHKEIQFSTSSERITIYKDFKKGSEHSLTIAYVTSPKQTTYFLGWNDHLDDNEQIWTQGQGKYTSHWLPSFDAMEEKVEFDLTITIPEGYQVIANGKLSGISSEEPNFTKWSFDMKKPMSSYLLAFAIGTYKKQELKSASGIPIENYYYPKDSLKVEPTYRYTKEIFDFLEAEIGYPYPWQNYKQVPVYDFLYAGMENTTATIFSDQYVIDSTAFVDKNYVNVNAHELAHQWFGNLVTEKDGNHHWLHEGFATYYAQLAEKELFGDDHYYFTLFNSLKELQQITDRGEGQSLLDPKASSLTFYEKGAWALFVLRHELGEEAFRKGIKNYLEKFKFKNATVNGFLTEMVNVSGKDLSGFRREWLENTEIPFEKAVKLLRENSKSLKLLFAMETELEEAQRDDIDYFNYWGATKSIHLKSYMVQKYHRILPQGILEMAFASDSVPIRQQLAMSVNEIPAGLKTNFESLLQDKSYVTIESALIKLWMSYPEERAKYLEKTKSIQGLPNKNIRLLWLTLAILTNDYDARNTQAYFQELGRYTAPEHGWEIRMSAFQYVREIGFTDESLGNLINASVHHSWQFKKFARNLIDELLEDTDYKNRIVVLSEELKGDELRYIKTKLN